MGWSKGLTLPVFYIVLAISIVLMMSYMLIVIQLLDTKYRRESFYPIFISMYGNAYGCLWFRITRSRSPLCTAVHGIWHIMIFIMTLYTSPEEIADHLERGKCSFFYFLHGRSMLPIILSLLQLLLSFHFMVFRSGVNPGDKAFRAEMHAFIGVLIHICCVIDSAAKVSSIFTVQKFGSEVPFHGLFYVFAHALCIWFLMLLPFFEWRRLNTLSNISWRPRIAVKQSARISSKPDHRTAATRQYP